MGAPESIAGTNAIALSFSGGGMRAAAFSHGVLQALAALRTPEGDLLDDVTFINSVSGGSLTAAYFALNGREGMSRYRDEVLVRDFEGGMRLDLWLPWNLARLLGGGLNVRENFGDVLDRQVFHRATFADIYRRGSPAIRINATDLYNRVPFPFIPEIFSLICSDLSGYSVADAVAASMAVPLVFAPIVLRTYPGECGTPTPASLDMIRSDPDSSRLAKAAEAAIRSYREAPDGRYIKLVDGGTSDNYGLSTLILSHAIRGTPYAPMSERDAVRIRRLLFVVVDALRGPAGDWALEPEGPAGVELALAAGDAAVDAAARLAADAFIRTVREWHDAVIAYRCALGPDEVARLGGPLDWNCADVRFTVAFVSIDALPDEQRSELATIPTRLSLSGEQIDAAIEGGRQAALASPRLRDYLRERIPQTPAAGSIVATAK